MKSEEKKWIVIRTLSRNEKKVKVVLDKTDFENYLPLIKTIRIWSDRKKKIELPLFPGYIFLYIRESNINFIYSIPGVVGYIKFNNVAAAVPEKDIIFIRQLIEDEIDMEVSDEQYKIGQKVKINYRSLLDYEGTIIEFRGSKRFSVQIEALNKTIILPAHYLEFI